MDRGEVLWLAFLGFDPFEGTERRSRAGRSMTMCVPSLASTRSRVLKVLAQFIQLGSVETGAFLGFDPFEGTERRRPSASGLPQRAFLGFDPFEGTERRLCCVPMGNPKDLPWLRPVRGYWKVFRLLPCLSDT